MPNLTFLAAGADFGDVVDVAFRSGDFRIFEAYSKPDQQIIEFDAARDVPFETTRSLMLYAIGSGPEPRMKRIDLNQGALSGASFRYACEGWGLIALQLAGVGRSGELRWSTSNHNSEKRAAAWGETLDHLGESDAWDWKAVTAASRRVNRAIQKLAVAQLGTKPVMPVLPAAAKMILDRGLRYRYGDAVHAEPRPSAPELHLEWTPRAEPIANSQYS